MLLSQFMADGPQFTIPDLTEQAQQQVDSIDFDSLTAAELLEEFKRIALENSVDAEARKIVKDAFRPIVLNLINTLLGSERLSVEDVNELIPLYQIYSATVTGIIFTTPILRLQEGTTALDLEEKLRAMLVSGVPTEHPFEYFTALGGYLEALRKLLITPES